MGRLLQGVLLECGFKSVITTVGLAQTEKMLRTRSVDIVLVDWTGEGSDGLRILRMIRKAKDIIDPKLPVIMMAGDASVTKVTRARDAGATEFVAKPVSVKTLNKVLEAALERRRPFVKTEQFFGPDRRRRDVNVANPRRRADRAAKAG